MKSKAWFVLAAAAVGMLSLISKAEPPPNPFDKSVYKSDQLIVGFSDKNQINYEISGTDPDTLSSELLGYFQRAVASGVVTKNYDATLGATVYSAGHFEIIDARKSDKNVFPPLALTVHRSTLNTWPNWGVVYKDGQISLDPSSDDAMMLAKIMAAAGVKGIYSTKSWSPALRYAGKKIICLMNVKSKTDLTPLGADCWLTMQSPTKAP